MRDDEDYDVEEPQLYEIDESWNLDRLNEYRNYLQETLLRLQTEAGSIRNQLSSAQQEAYQTGKYADRGWWRRANDALVYKKRWLQAVQLALGNTNRMIKQAQHVRNESTQDRAFIKAARRLLSEQQFQDILRASREYGDET